MASISISDVDKDIIEMRDRLANKHGMSKAEMDKWGYETGIKRQATLNKFNTAKGKAPAKAKAAKPAKTAAKASSKAKAAKPAAKKPAKKGDKPAPAKPEIVEDLD